MKNPTKLALAALCGLSFLGPAFAQEAQLKIPAQVESDWMSDFSRNLWQGLTRFNHDLQGGFTLS
jgi:hypothetical protein